MEQALAFSPGLRLLRQDAWEVLITFILSQNTNIPRIKKMIALLCECCGRVLPCGGCAFPTPHELVKLSAEDLRPVKCGYRAIYIIDAARRVCDGSVNLTALAAMPSDYVKQALLNIKGVGDKVAECVLLYGFGRVERYPRDRWIKKVMASYYPEGFPEGLRNYAGIAQQYLFHYARMHLNEELSVIKE